MFSNFLQERRFLMHILFCLSKNIGHTSGWISYKFSSILIIWKTRHWGSPGCQPAVPFFFLLQMKTKHRLPQGVSLKGEGKKTERVTDKERWRALEGGGKKKSQPELMPIGPPAPQRRCVWLLAEAALLKVLLCIFNDVVRKSNSETFWNHFHFHFRAEVGRAELGQFIADVIWGLRWYGRRSAGHPQWGEVSVGERPSNVSDISATTVEAIEPSEEYGETVG